MVIGFESINKRLDKIREQLAFLESFKKISYEKFCEPEKHLAAERALQLALEACHDIATHIVSACDMGTPDSYEHAYELLAQYHVVPADFAKTLIQMAGFRNRLVHVYLDLDLGEVHNIIQTRLGDLEAFGRYICEFLDRT